MKRSLTIGCVLLVGSGVTNCGGSAELGTPDGESGAHAGASGSGVAGGFTGTIELGVVAPVPTWAWRWSRVGAGASWAKSATYRFWGPLARQTSGLRRRRWLAGRERRCRRR